MVALLNDDSNEVGRVHLGVVHVFELDEPKVEKNEAMITNLAFLSPEELRARRDLLESWSQICLDGLGELLEDTEDLRLVTERLKQPGKTYSALEVKRILGESSEEDQSRK